jgi:DNA-binding NtrC family response regulator
MADFDVLLVDDEADFLETLLKRLRKRGFNAFTASNGQEALGILDKTAIDVVVLDWKMPGMDGLETLKEIKKIKPLIEVIILTGYTNVEAGIQGMELGAFDFLMKPVNIEELLYKLQDAYTRKCLQESKMKLGHAADVKEDGEN